MKRLMTLVLAWICVLALAGCNNRSKDYKIDFPFEAGNVENVEMYHFDGAPMSAEKKVIVDKTGLYLQWNEEW